MRQFSVLSFQFGLPDTVCLTTLDGPGLKLKTENRSSPFDPESRIAPGRLDGDLFDLFDAGVLGAGGEVVFEALDAVGRAFGEDFDAAVLQVADVADDLVARGDSLREEAEPHALHLAADEVVPRDLHAPPPCTADVAARWTGYPKRSFRKNAIYGISSTMRTPPGGMLRVT